MWKHKEMQGADGDKIMETGIEMVQLQAKECQELLITTRS